MPYSIPHLYVTGDHYEVGFQVGAGLKDRIQKYFDSFDDFNKIILPYIECEHGNKIFTNYFENINKHFPWYVDEIRGIADGANLPFNWVLAINLRVELTHVGDHPDCEIINEDVSKECSDFHLVNDAYHLLAHNEDAAPAVYETGYIVTVRTVSKDYNGRKSPKESFTCYCYPGHLPGNAFGFNEAGFIFGVNALYPRMIALNRIPRQFMNRVMLSANTLEELENMLLNLPISYGVCLNVSYCKNDQSVLKTKWNSEYYSDDNQTENTNLYPISWNYELAPNPNSTTRNTVSKRCIVSVNLRNDLPNDGKFYSFGFLSHFNHYDRILIDECVVTSSRKRAARTKQMPPPKTREDLLNFVSDSADADFPIFRNPTPTDSGKTVSTAVFDMKRNLMSVYVGRPNGNYELLLHVPIGSD